MAKCQDTAKLETRHNMTSDVVDRK